MEKASNGGRNDEVLKLVKGSPAIAPSSPFNIPSISSQSLTPSTKRVADGWRTVPTPTSCRRKKEGSREERERERERERESEREREREREGERAVLVVVVEMAVVVTVIQTSLLPFYVRSM